MAERDIKTAAAARIGLNFQTIASDTTTNGLVINMVGFESIFFSMQTGAVTSGDVSILIEDSKTGAFSGEEAEVSDDFLIGTEDDTLLDTANTIVRIGYNGKKQFVRASVVTNNSANLEVGMQAILSDAVSQPVI